MRVLRAVLLGMLMLGLLAGGAPAFAKKKKKEDGVLKAPPLPKPAGQNQAGLKDIMGSPARDLFRIFGDPVQDVREETARKLQWTNEFCVLDTYLYPPSAGQTPVVTYVAARVPDGRTADAASCVMTLQRR